MEDGKTMSNIESFLSKPNSLIWSDIKNDPSDPWTRFITSWLILFEKYAIAFVLKFIFELILASTILKFFCLI